jgi:ATP-binding cassette subfamily F protein 3
MALTDALEVFEGAVLIVTHNEDILRRTAKRLIVYQGEAPFLFEGGYDDFLEMIGWEEEADLIPKGKRKGNAPSSGSSRDRKKDRADIIQERSRVLTPLKTQVEKSEKRIEELEKSIEVFQQKIATASSQKNADEIKRVSQELASMREGLEQEVRRWEESSQELEKQEKIFAVRMEESNA